MQVGGAEALRRFAKFSRRPQEIGSKCGYLRSCCRSWQDLHIETSQSIGSLPMFLRAYCLWWTCVARAPQYTQRYLSRFKTSARLRFQSSELRYVVISAAFLPPFVERPLVEDNLEAR
jgi:hypothetical protein